MLFSRFAAAHGADNTQNFDETGLDCGGSCSSGKKCAVGAVCVQCADCISDVCAAGYCFRK